MKCPEIEGDLSTYLAGEADPGLCRSIKAHLRGCKKCRTRIAALKAEKGGLKKAKEVAISSEEVASPPQETSSGFPSTSGILSALWRRPVEMTVTTVLIGGTLFLYHRGTSDLRAVFPMTENVAAPVAEEWPVSPPAENHGDEEKKETPIPPQPPEIKLLLISRSIKEAADTVSSQGKVLSRKGDEMEVNLVLLIPAERYETFSRSLESLGLVKEISKKQPPAVGSLKVEVTIE